MIDTKMVTELIRRYESLRIEAGESDTPKAWRAASQAANDVLAVVPRVRGRGRKTRGTPDRGHYLVASAYCRDMADKLENDS